MAIMEPDALMRAIREEVRKPEKCWHEAPFDPKGNQVSYPEWNTEMRDVAEFEDTLTFVEFRRGRSAANGIWRRTDGTTVVMFLTDMEKLVRWMRDGKVEGLWRYVKRGANYGVAYA